MLEEGCQLREVANHTETLQVADLTAGQQLLGRQTGQCVDLLKVALVPAFDKEAGPDWSCVSQRAGAEES